MDSTLQPPFSELHRRQRHRVRAQRRRWPAALAAVVITLALFRAMVLLANVPRHEPHDDAHEPVMHATAPDLAPRAR